MSELAVAIVKNFNRLCTAWSQGIELGSLALQWTYKTFFQVYAAKCNNWWKLLRFYFPSCSPDHKWKCLFPLPLGSIPDPPSLRYSIFMGLSPIYNIQSAARVLHWNQEKLFTDLYTYKFLKMICFFKKPLTMLMITMFLLDLITVSRIPYNRPIQVIKGPEPH